MQITVISGTNREGSQTLVVSNYIQSCFAAQEGVDAGLLDLRDLPSELLSPGAYAEKPAGFAPLVEQVLSSDGLVLVVPEYNGSYPGALKLFIDMLPFPQAFDKRPVAFVGIAAGRWGGLRPVEQLQQVFGYRNACQFPERVFLPSIGQSITAEGAPTDPFVEGLLASQVTGFVDFVRRLHA